jgi:hypothetical protein
VYLNRGAVREVIRVARRHATGRHRLVVASYAAGYVVVRALLDLARWIDDRLWPEIAQQVIRPPVFIFGNARSGTTLLHRLMSLDEERFTSMKLYQSIFPRVCVIRPLMALARLDACLPGRPLHRALGAFNRRVFTTWEGIHDMGLDLPEEDEAIYTLCMMTPAAVLLLPWLDEMPLARSLDDQPAAERRAFMDHYEDALRRHLFAVGGDRVFLNKSVLFQARIRTVFERFPEARFVYLVRHPFEAIPSFLSMFHAKWRTHTPSIEADSPEARALARMAIDYYRIALDARAFIPADQFVAVRYDDLIAEPKASIAKIQQRLGLEPGAGFAAALDRALEDGREYVSGHRYSLAQFGLDEVELHAELADVFDEFGFEPPRSMATSASATG